MGNARDFEWVRERLKRENKEPNKFSANRKDWLLREAQRTDGDKAVRELKKEFKA